MQVSIETTTGLERRLTVEIPSNEVDSAVNTKLKETAGKIRLNGFRPGKVPVSEVKKRYGNDVRMEVITDIMQNSFMAAIAQEKIQPAGYPTSLEPVVNEAGLDFKFAAVFEVYPIVIIEDLEGVEIEKYSSEIKEEDIDHMITTLRKQRATHEEADRAAKDGDKVELDYTGTKDGEEFAGGSAKESSLVLGSGGMIPGFESGIEGMKAGEEKELKLTFPEDYHSDDLKGQDVVFSVVLNKVFDEVLPEVDAEFMKVYSVEDGSMDSFRAEIIKNMERELKNAIKNKLKSQVMDKLIEKNEIELPEVLIKGEIQRQKDAMFQQFGGGQGQQFDTSILPDDMFQDQAAKAVKLGILINEMINKEELKADADRVKALIEEIAQSYQDPQEVINYYYSNHEQLQQMEGVVIEEQIVELLLEKAKVKEVAVSYEEAVKPAAPSSDK